MQPEHCFVPFVKGASAYRVADRVADRVPGAGGFSGGTSETLSDGHPQYRWVANDSEIYIGNISTLSDNVAEVYRITLNEVVGGGLVECPDLAGRCNKFDVRCRTWWLHLSVCKCPAVGSCPDDSDVF